MPFLCFFVNPAHVCVHAEKSLVGTTTKIWETSKHWTLKAYSATDCYAEGITWTAVEVRRKSDADAHRNHHALACSFTLASRDDLLTHQVHTRLLAHVNVAARYGLRHQTHRRTVRHTLESKEDEESRARQRLARCQARVPLRRPMFTAECVEQHWRERTTAVQTVQKHIAQHGELHNRKRGRGSWHTSVAQKVSETLQEREVAIMNQQVVSAC